MNTQSWVNWQRAVIKVGSALIAPGGTQVSDKYIFPIAVFINHARALGKEVVLVSSGSVAAGRSDIKCHNQGVTITEKQAMAAIGQAKMMANWQQCFNASPSAFKSSSFSPNSFKSSSFNTKHGNTNNSNVNCAQLLITHEDLRDRKRYVNIKNTVRELLANDVIPIINENDTVATEELKVGDNDNLAALVALVCDADALFICSDIDGLFDADPKTNPTAKLLPNIEAITKEIYALAGDTQNKIATGGMITKLQAAEKATNNGIHTFIVNGKNENTFSKLSDSQHVGTWFKAVSNKETAKKRWLKYTLKSNGKIVVDKGAANALLGNGASLLAKGIVSVQGDFIRGDAINIEYNNEVIAKGLSQYSNTELTLVLGKESAEFESILGFRLDSKHTEEIIHRDDLVLFTR